MAYHNKVSASKFEKNATGAEKFSEQELMDAVNDNYSTKQKLKIYAVLTSLSNCSEKERKKYAKKVKKLL